MLIRGVGDSGAAWADAARALSLAADAHKRSIRAHRAALASVAQAMTDLESAARLQGIDLTITETNQSVAGKAQHGSHTRKRGYAANTPERGSII